MTALLVAVAIFGVPLIAFGLHELQARLERWEYERHAED